MDKKTQALVDQYASSLLEVAMAHNQLEAVKDDVTAILSVFDKEELNSLMSNFALSREDKASVVRLFQEFSSTYVNNFLEVILQNEREHLLYAICQAFLEKEAKATNTHDIYVTTAISLSAEQKKRFLAIAKEKLAISAGQLVEIVDEGIIGGFIINANNQTIDMSIRSQLQQFKQNLK
ncbi:F0F1 ATP synthase subunit delta [Streptococcus sp. zg-JUN1979]|uniref:F0F1 ATP synthase subunit delta n=1 Tax=Streptococcus sp. zg-JUN1979 TaxID=3391450 RepID=UPI0039A422F4